MRPGARPLVATIAALATLAVVPSAPAVYQRLDEHAHGKLDFDRRGGDAVAPTAAQRAAVRTLGARATFNDFGTPASLISDRGPLATGVPGATAPAKARAFLKANRALFRLTDAQVDGLDVLHDQPLGEQGRAVLLRQRFGDLDAAAGGLVALALRGSDVVYASSSLGPDGAAPAPATLTAQDAFVRAARALDRKVDAADLKNLRNEKGWATFDVAGLDQPGRARLVVLPVPGGTPRVAFKTIVADVNGGLEPLAVTTFVDARTGALLARRNNVDNAVDNPQWEVFPANPDLFSTDAADTRERWCWKGAAGCDRVIGGPSTPERTGEWDTQQTTADGSAVPTGTTNGNAARTEDASVSNPFTPGATTDPRPQSPTRDYGPSSGATFTNAWRRAQCNPAVFADRATNNDIPAAKANLFVMHNRMHDFGYHLGFTEQTYNLQVNNFGRTSPDRQGDPELGDVQAGAVAGGPPTFRGRDNANQITLDDGIAPITNMYLWQPIAAAFYPPCVDGDFDMSVIGHEYTHAISNRMVAGPDDGLDAREARSMGESWSDLVGVEYLNEYGFVPTNGENPFAVGPYVTGDLQAGIRNYGMNASPLNYSNVGYDIVGAQVHADGEIWSAVNFAIRQAMIERHGAGDPALQVACANGERPADQCPGNRRWVQILFDAFLLMPSNVSMVEARDAYLAADRARFGGANQDLLWDVFARRGLGENAQADPRNVRFDEDDETEVTPRASFSSPVTTDDTTVTFAPSAQNAQLFVGPHEARTTPLADTDPDTPIGAEQQMRPGTYDFVARADGFGTVRFRETIPAGRDVRLEVPFVPNVASVNAGAVATGDALPPPTIEDPIAEPPDGKRLLRNLIDDTEATNWATRTSDRSNVAGRQVTVDLAGNTQTVDRVQVSALLRAQDPNDFGGDRSPQNRFTALRSFALEACNATAANDQCAAQGAFRRFYTSPADAFPSVAPRPRTPDLNLRAFDVPDTRATHLRMVVVTNQCMGGPDFQGEQDADPNNSTDCDADSRRDEEVRAAELQAFSAPAGQPRVVDTTAPAPGAAPAPAPAPAATPGPASASEPSRSDEGDAPFACTTTPGFRSTGARPAGRGLRLTFTRTTASRVDVDVFQVARGREVIGERLVARFRNRSSSFRWNGRANRRGRKVRDGFYVVRYRTREPDGSGTDTRRVALRRSRGRFAVRPDFYGRTGCGLLRSFKLERPAFGGRKNRALLVSFILGAPAEVTVEILRGTRVVRRYRREDVRTAVTQRLRFDSERRPLGDYRVRITARRGGETMTQTLVARRL